MFHIYLVFCKTIEHRGTDKYLAAMAARAVPQIFVAPPTPSPVKSRSLGDRNFDLVHPSEEDGVA
jgi:hypothetical protein